MSKTLILCSALALINTACSGKTPYCCTLKAMAGNTDYKQDVRSKWAKIAAGENEDVCKTEVENELADYSDFETALAQCASE